MLIHYTIYNIAQNVDGGKHWQIPLKTVLAKKILANASLTSNETLLAKMIAIINTFVVHKFSITPYMYSTCTCRCVLGVNFSTSV